ncbi:hypothetical protein PS395_00220 [Limosilactobacillus pontis]|uniref:hypothetical protein n=1 Tax=Limosilactobacillus pontis TaxID=35787 RepID=UPI002F26A19C
MARLNAVSHHPLVAIGRISAANLPATLQTGVAVISMILASPDITATVKAMRAAYQSK